MSPNTTPTREADASVLVAITASAARIGSLEAVLTTLPPREDAALIMVLQLREALDEARLRAAAGAGGHTLVEIADGMPVEPGRLYLPPMNVIATLEDGRFRTHPAEQAPGARGVIDSFLVSLATQGGGRALVVALDGTDGDGTLGVKEIKEAGGLALAEDTEESRAHALASSDSPVALADAVLPVAELAGRIVILIQQIGETADPGAAAAPDTPEARAALGTIAGILRSRTGHDFHGYKPGTFLRRVQRRMQALMIGDLSDYIETLRASPTEAQDLFNDLLIGVTEFFRDRREWELLEREVVPRLFEGKGPRDPLRVWVVGCSTGEEAYSIAILLAEHRARMDDPPPVQIFASDLDGRALAAARAGRYADRIAGQMSPERLGRFFVKEGDTYCVTKELREMCVFSQHSLIKDAPFSRLDLVSCRNLLIYLDAELQERVIPLFHFALRPGRFLFLGNSENASRHTALFAPLEARSRIFRRLDTATRVLPDFPFTAVDRRALTQGAPLPPAEPTRSDGADLTRWAERVIEQLSPAYVIVDPQHNVLHFSGTIGPFLAPSRGAASLNLLQLIHPALRLDLRTALARAAEQGHTAELHGLELATHPHRLIDLVVEPRLSASGMPTGFLVAFKDRQPHPDSAAPGAAPSSADPVEHTRRLEDELRVTRDHLQGTVEELESTNEELKSSNEEYQSLNEELQSANEELETSKEELQSVNEELTTVNGELAHRVQELGRANSDLKNFLEATQIATLFLDNELRVTNFTPATADLFHLLESDEGRPITHIKARVHYDEIERDARRVLRTLVPVEREVGDPETGARFAVRVLPYRSTDNVIAGVVVTFVDVTARREAEERLRESEERQAFLLKLGDALRAEPSADAVTNRAIAMLSGHLQLDRCYVGVYRLAEDRGDFTHQVGNDRVPPLPAGVRLSDFPAALRVAFDRTLVIEDIATAEGLTATDRQNLAGLGYRGLVAASLRRGENKPLWSIVGVSADPRRWTAGEVALMEEVTERTWAAVERVRAEAALRASEARLKNVLQIQTVGVMFWGKDFALTEVNDAFLRLTGFTREESLGRTWADLTPPEFHEASRKAVEEVLTLGGSTPYEKQYFRKDGSRWWGLFAARRIGDEVVEFVLDVTERREAEEALQESEARLATIFASASVGLSEITLEGRFLQVNDELCRILGRSRDELLRLSIPEVTHPEDIPPSLEAVVQARQGSTASLDKRYQRPDGSAIWANSRVAVLRHGEGQPDTLLAVTMDITERREAEAALRESEERFRAIVETAKDYAIFTTDAGGRIETWPTGAHEVFGWTAEEAVGRPVDITFTPEDREAHQPETERQEARDAGQAPNVRWHVRKDGSRVFIEGITRPLTGPDGQILGFLKIGQDVSERRVAEQALHDSELRFRTLAEGIPQLVWRAVDDGHWTWASPQWTAFTGQAEEASHGRGWLDALHPDDRQAAREAWEQSKTTGTFEANYRIREATSGTYRFFQTRARPVRDEAGAIVEWLGTSTDVQHLRELQDRQGVLVAELQHRTRNLMGVVRATLATTLGEHPTQEAFVPAFRGRLDALARVQGLLSRLHEGDRVAFDELLRTELGALGAVDADGRGERVTLDGPRGVRLRSSTVQTFALALHELATNAAKYGALAQRDGQLAVRWRMLRGKDGPRLRVEWIETGVAMPEPGAAPQGTGYGRELIERALPYQLKAETTYELGADGVRCTITLPLSSREERADA
ncbi:PAS domain S-box protein [Rubellimicrobium arenae]|uniref:PAS domain S-box protein n=1 Tax=Rubellimicrobium arenae TaxID=2817372 RepID=UPI001B300AF9|nr:PAS domain S-box protein [Rubellimicrobium arenae]